MEIPIQVGVHNKTALGVFHVASQQKEVPLVIIMCYGLNGDRVEQHRMSVNAGRLASENAINFIRMDYCDQGVSQGSFDNVTISSKIDNILHLINEVKGYFGKKKISIYLIGFSDGARIAVNVASVCNDVKGIILWNPIIKLPHIGDEPANPNKTSEKLHLDKNTKKLYKKILGVKLNTTAIREMKDDNGYDLLKNYSNPILYIFGSEDRFTKSLQGIIYDIGLFRISKDCVHTIEGARHIFSSTYFENEVINSTINWVTKNT